MRFKRILPRLATIPAILLVATGCGGFQGSKSISPATFLLPGLMKADPPQESEKDVVPSAKPVAIVAQSQ